MKFGCCGNMVAAGVDKTGIEIINQLETIGYDYIELPLAQLMELDDIQFKKIKEKIERSDIKCEVCNCLFPAYLKITGSNVNIPKIQEYIENAFIRAEELGVEYIVFGSGPAKKVPDGFPMEKAWGQLIILSKFLDSIAKKNNIIILVEALRRVECNIVNTIAEGYKLVKAVKGNNFSLVADYYHMAIEREDPEILIGAADYIKHVHFARVEGRVFPKNIYEDSYLPFINALKLINYHGRVSIEAYSSDFYNDAVISLQFLKRFF